MQLLISVKNSAEAAIASSAGADIVDLKDPEVGALGALDIDLTREIVALLQQNANKNKCLISATVGENHATLAQLLADIKARAEAGIDIVKVAVSDLFQELDFYNEIKKITKTDLTNNNIKLVAVFFADEAINLDILPLLKNAGFYGAMLDTNNKRSSLLQLMSENKIYLFVQLCNQQGLSLGLAGSLQIQDIDKLLTLNPTYIGFRGGVCENGARKHALNKAKVHDAKNMLRIGNKKSINMQLI